MNSIIILSILTIILRCSMSDYVYGGSISNGETWADAEHHCNTLFNTHLASIHSSEDNAQVQSICEEHVTANKICIIGLIAVDGTWMWEDGSEVDYEYWQPAAGGESDTGYCTWLNTNVGGKWNDVPCIRYLKDNIHFICNAPTETQTDICSISSDKTITRTIELNTCSSGDGLSYTEYCDENNNFVYTEFDGSDCQSGNEIESTIFPNYKYCCEEPAEDDGYCDFKVDTCEVYSYNYIDALTGEPNETYESSYSEIYYCDYSLWRENGRSGSSQWHGPTLVLERYLNKDDCTVSEPWDKVQTFKWYDSWCCPL